MAKYSVVRLDINRKDLIGIDNLRDIEKKRLTTGNVIYIYRGTKTHKIYIGQTTNFMQRHNQHYDGTEEKFNTAGFDKVIIIYSQYFNRSALDDVESQMITYFKTDKPRSKKSSVEFDTYEVINNTCGNNVNDYADREKVASEVILPFWEDILYKEGWVSTPSLEELRSNALVKYSPIKNLSDEQRELINEILNNPTTNFVINGDAGTGKTVLLTHIVAKIFVDQPEARIGVVVQPNWEKTGKEIFRIYGMNSSRLDILTSTKLINNGDKYDVIIVDESHKLSRKYGKQDPSFNKVYKRPGNEDCESHLEIIQKLGTQIILMYDVLQAIRPANITREMFKELTKDYAKRFLKTQFRIQTSKKKSYTSDDYINGIKYLLFKDTKLLTSEFTNFDPSFNREVFRDNDSDAYFGYVTGKPMRQLFDWVEDDRNFNPEHINRVLSGMFCCDTVDKWAVKDGKDPSIKHFHEGDFNRRWNSTQENWININDDDAEDQIGSVFAVQGIDLNTIGVMIGPDITVNDEGKLEAVPDNHNNVKNKFTVEEMEIRENQYEFTLYILNQYYVLLTRGIDGIRVGFWENEVFRRYMEDVLEIV